MSAPDRLPADELFVLCTWAVQALANQLRIDEDVAYGMLESAERQGRIQILGTSVFTGVQCDGQWVVVESRARLTEATHEWQTLRFLEGEFRQ